MSGESEIGTADRPAASGQPVQYATQEGETITFGDSAVTWEELDAPTGEHVVGFIVEDLDGNEAP